MRVKGELMPIPLGDAARSLRSVLDMLLQDMAFQQVDPATLAWDEPIFVVRSANMERMRAFLHEVVAHNPAPVLHIMSHVRDESAIRALAPCDFTFHAYPTPGPYRLEDVPAATLERLQSVGIGNLFLLDSATSGDLLEEVERLLAAIAERRMVSFRSDGTYARTPDWRQRGLAKSAFFRLIEWYQLKVDPGSPEGPALPGDARAASLK